MHYPHDNALETKIPPGPSGFSLVRALPRLARDPFTFCMNLAAENEGLVRIGAGSKEAYLVSHPDFVHHVLVAHADNYIKGSMMDSIRVALGNGLFTAEGKQWKKHRSLMQPAFQAKQVNQISTIVDEVVNDAQQRWRQAADTGKPLDMLVEAGQINIRVVLQSLLGKTLEPEHSKRLLQLTNNVFQRMTKIVWTFFVPNWLRTPGRAAYNQVVADLDKEIYALIAERRQQSENHGFLLDQFLHLKDEETGEGMSDQQIRDEVFTIFMAGYESTASAIAWAAYLLSKHPEIEQLVYQEANEVLDSRTPTYMDLPQLPYARRVIDETLRLYPSFPMYFRTSVQDDVIGEYEVKANSFIVVSPYATHHDPRYWEEPQKFDPDRFTPERFDEQARKAYYPFGKGRRICIGRDMSVAIAITVLIAFVQKYRLTPAKGAQDKGRYAMTYQPYQMPLVLTPR